MRRLLVLARMRGVCVRIVRLGVRSVSRGCSPLVTCCLAVETVMTQSQISRGQGKLLRAEYELVA